MRSASCGSSSFVRFEHEHSSTTGGHEDTIPRKHGFGQNRAARLNRQVEKNGGDWNELETIRHAVDVRHAGVAAARTDGGPHRRISNRHEMTLMGADVD